MTVTLFPQNALSLFTSDSEITAEGVAYLCIVRFSYLFFALAAVMLGTLRIAGMVRIAVRVSVLSLLINVCINYLLIPGRYGFPELGVRGAAIGTLAARVIECLVVANYLFRKDQALRIRPEECVRLDMELLRNHQRRR